MPSDFLFALYSNLLIWVETICGLTCFCFIKGESYGAAIWQIPELYGQLNSPQLERIASLDAHVGKINWWVYFSYDCVDLILCCVYFLIACIAVSNFMSFVLPITVSGVRQFFKPYKKKKKEFKIQYMKQSCFWYHLVPLVGGCTHVVITFYVVLQYQIIACLSGLLGHRLLTRWITFCFILHILDCCNNFILYNFSCTYHVILTAFFGGHLEDMIS